jgi:hypothetical protein
MGCILHFANCCSGLITRHPRALDQSARTMLIDEDLSNNDRSPYRAIFVSVAIKIGGSDGPPMVPVQAKATGDGPARIDLVTWQRLGARGSIARFKAKKPSRRHEAMNPRESETQSVMVAMMRGI